MPNTNGHSPKRVIHCPRVSTDQRARSGYSLAQQIEADLYRTTPGAWHHPRDRRAGPKRR